MRGRVEDLPGNPGSPTPQGPDYYTFYDVFFWRDAPDWYRKTFHATGFGLAFCALKQYMNRCAAASGGGRGGPGVPSRKCGASPN